MRRVVITGLGPISPLGLGAAAHWDALLSQKSGIGPLTAFDPSAFPSQVAGQIPPFKTTDFVPKAYRKATKIMARDIEIAVVAADLAVKDARVHTKGVTPPADTPPLPWFKPDPARMGCNIGAGLISADLQELAAAMTQARAADNPGSLDLAKWGRSEDPNKPSGMGALTPLWLLKYLPNMLACHVSIIHDTQGPSNTITCGQASAGLALAEAARTIQRGHADLALAGGCESKVHPMGLMRWTLLNRLVSAFNATPASACRPYDATAAGSVLAEGGAVLVIEELQHALARGATIYAEIAGIGASSNGSAMAHVDDPDPSGEAPAVALKKAFGHAGITAADVQLLIPPAYSIPAWDQADAASFRHVFGTRIPPILPARAGVGDCGAGSQALDLVAATLALHHQSLPPATNITQPIADLPIIREKTSTPLTHAAVVMTSLGGQNSAIILKKY